MGKPRVRKRPGRKPALNEDVERRLLDAVRAGVPLKQAVLYAGIHEATLYRWIERGAEEQARQDAERTPAQRRENEEPEEWVEEPFRAFRERLLRARAETGVRHVGLINKAAAGGYVVKRKTTTMRNGDVIVEEEVAPVAWQASKWLLEKSFPRDFGQRAELDLHLSGTADQDSPDAVPEDAVSRIAAAVAQAHERQRAAIEAASTDDDAEPVDAEILDDA